MSNVTNAIRAEWASQAINGAFGSDEVGDESNLRDLLCNLRHWADARGKDWHEELRIAMNNYRGEYVEEHGVYPVEPKTPLVQRLKNLADQLAHLRGHIRHIGQNGTTPVIIQLDEINTTTEQLMFMVVQGG